MLVAALVVFPAEIGSTVVGGDSHGGSCGEDGGSRADSTSCLLRGGSLTRLSICEVWPGGQKVFAERGGLTSLCVREDWSTQGLSEVH